MITADRKQNRAYCKNIVFSLVKLLITPLKLLICMSYKIGIILALRDILSKNGFKGDYRHKDAYTLILNVSEVPSQVS